MRSKYLQVDGVATYYLHTGASTLPPVRPSLDRGELLVFVHGAGWNAGFWRRPLELFAAEHSALAFDFPGHGRSGGTEGLHSVAEYADFLASFLESLELRPFVLIGSTLGGAAAALYAARKPPSLRALVLVATPPCLRLPPPAVEIWGEVMRGRAAQPFSTELFAPGADFAVMREIWTEQVKTDPRVRYHDLLACADCDLGDAFGEIEVPTLVVAGAADQLLPLADVEAAHRRIARSRWASIDDAGHCVGAEQSEGFRGAVAEFLKALPA